jgi:hypothetical protein
MERNGNWDDGCFYYNGVAAPEFEDQIKRAKAAIRKAGLKP